MTDVDKSILELLVSIPITAALIYLLIIKARGENKGSEVVSGIAKLFSDSQSNSDKILEANTRQLRILSNALRNNRNQQEEQSKLLQRLLETFSNSIESLDRRTGYLVTLTQQGQSSIGENMERIEKLEAWGVETTGKWYDIFEKIYGKLDGLDGKVNSIRSDYPAGDNNLRLRQGVIFISRDCVVRAINGDALSILGVREADVLGTCVDTWLSNMLDENMKRLNKDTSPIHRVLRTGIPHRNVVNGYYPPDSPLPRWIVSDIEPVIYLDEATGNSSWSNMMMSFRDIGSIVSYNEGALTRATRELPVVR